MTHVVLSLGSNIDRESNIRFAWSKIVERFGETENSPIYETGSMGFEGPSFLNFVLGFHSPDPIFIIREYLRSIEAAAGRIRGKKAFDNRILDIDIVLLHYWFALSVIILAGIHALAALRHHFIGKNDTLLRMLPKKFN